MILSTAKQSYDSPLTLLADIEESAAKGLLLALIKAIYNTYLSRGNYINLLGSKVIRQGIFQFYILLIENIVYFLYIIS